MYIQYIYIDIYIWRRDGTWQVGCNCIHCVGRWFVHSTPPPPPHFQLECTAEGLITEKVWQLRKVTGNLIFGDVTHVAIRVESDHRPIPPPPILMCAGCFEKDLMNAKGAMPDTRRWFPSWKWFLCPGKMCHLSWKTERRRAQKTERSSSRRNKGRTNWRVCVSEVTSARGIS